MNLLFSFCSALLSYITYRLYLAWRRFKNKGKKSKKLELGDYRLLIQYWTLIIIFVLASIIFFFKAFIE